MSERWIYRFGWLFIVTVFVAIIAICYGVVRGDRRRDARSRADCRAMGGTVLPAPDGWTCGFRCQGRP